MAEVDAVCEHVHLPMQSGSTRVLKRMLRRYTREGYLECVAKLRAGIPGSLVDDGRDRRLSGRNRRRTSRKRSSVVREVGFADGVHVQVLTARRDAGDAHACRADGVRRSGE